ncbi:MAG: triose-phosphate isomerase [Bacteroidia bacterium]
MRKKIVAGNWKMNKTLQEGLQLIDELLREENDINPDVIKIIAPPFIHLSKASEKLKEKKNYFLAAQNCHQLPSGAYTGEVSAEMISSVGATHVIIGHSERRLYFNETDCILSQKVDSALSVNLIPIFCIGESLEERNANKHLETVKKQLKESLFHLSPKEFSKLIIAYEPVWAIGTGMTATSHQAQGMHHFIRTEISKKYGKEISEQTSILYGGSCNANNAKEIFACLDVDGGLIGGASLKATEFNIIINSF